MNLIEKTSNDYYVIKELIDNKWIIDNNGDAMPTTNLKKASSFLSSIDASCRIRKFKDGIYQVVHVIINA